MRRPPPNGPKETPRAKKEKGVQKSRAGEHGGTGVGDKKKKGGEPGCTHL